MKYFVDVVNLNSFTKAAKLNYVAQTAISHSISKIEKKYEAKLLIRSRGNIKPTKYGEIVYKEFVDILSLHSISMKKVEKMKKVESDKKTIFIGFIDYFELVDFDSRLEELRSKFKGYDFKIVDKYSVEEEYTDIDIGYDFEFTRSNFQYEGKLLNMKLLVSKNNNISTKSVVSLDDIKNETIYILSRKREKRNLDFNKYISQELVYIEDNINYVYSALERRSLVECDNGVALIESNMFHYNEERCTAIDLVGKDRKPLYPKIKYNIYYKDKSLKKIAEFLSESILL